MSNRRQFDVSLSFAEIQLPPVSDILVLAKKHAQGKSGVMEAFHLIAPDEFEMYEVADASHRVEAVLIHRRILSRLPGDEVLAILRQHVFPYVNPGEAIKVDFDLTVRVAGITGDIATR